jgi:hypothetical protein
LILSARIDATLLIRLDGCHAKTFSNEQGQELDIKLINATKTLHNENLQDLVNIFSFFVVTRERVKFFASGIVLAGPTPAILLDYDGLAGML